MRLLHQTVRSILAVACIVLVAPAGAGAVVPALDIGWDGDGILTQPNAYANAVDVRQQYLDVTVSPIDQVVAVGMAGGGALIERRLANGTLDATFGTGGRVYLNPNHPAVDNGTAYRVLRAPNGSYFVAGATQFTALDVDIWVAHLEGNGTLDLNYGVGGFARLTAAVDPTLGQRNEVPHELVLDTQSRIIVFGQGFGLDPVRTEDFLVARLTATGAPDTTFHGDGVAVTSIVALMTGEAATSGAALGDGSVLAAGSTSLQPPGGAGLPPWSAAIVRYRPDGSLEPSFGNAGTWIANEQGGYPGSYAPTYGSNSRIQRIHVQSSCTYLVTGHLGDGNGGTGATHAYVARLTDSGAFDPTFGTGGVTTIPIGAFGNVVIDSVVDSSGAIILLGKRSTVTDDYALTLTRVLANGTLDASFGTGGTFVQPDLGTRHAPDKDDDATAIALAPNGAILVAGNVPGISPADGGDPNIAALLRYAGAGFGPAPVVNPTCGTTTAPPTPPVVTPPPTATPPTDDDDDDATTPPVNQQRSGTSGNNVMNGAAGNDVFRGLGGNDTLRGNGGNDSLFGGVGNDRLLGGAQNDMLNGGPGNDVMIGGPGNDRLFGVVGRDQLSGGPGNDQLTCGRGDRRGTVVADGGAGIDVIRCRNGRVDIVRCGAGRDTAIVDPKDTVTGCERVLRG
jgi:uncharacterized delta-60 repeat protein